MKTNYEVYEKPSIEVYEMEIEDAILVGSDRGGSTEDIDTDDNNEQGWDD